MKNILSTILLLTVINSYGQTPKPTGLNTDIAIKIVKDNLSKKDSTFRVLFVYGTDIISERILDSLHKTFPIIITDKYQVDTKYLEGEMNCFIVTVYSTDNAYIKFMTVSASEQDPGVYLFVPSNKDYKNQEYNYDKNNHKLIKIEH